jgi:hypothetical protein
LVKFAPLAVRLAACATIGADAAKVPLDPLAEGREFLRGSDCAYACPALPGTRIALEGDANRLADPPWPRWRPSGTAGVPRGPIRGSFRHRSGPDRDSNVTRRFRMRALLVSAYGTRSPVARTRTADGKWKGGGEHNETIERLV